jgi:thioredoxin 1
MAMNNSYAAVEPARAEVDLLEGPTVIEFGAPWCGFCQAAQPLLAAAFADHPDVRHIKIEDGKGRRLGRSFSVKLWPTLIFLRDGKETARLVRPGDAGAIREALESSSGKAL